MSKLNWERAKSDNHTNETHNIMAALPQRWTKDKSKLKTFLEYNNLPLRLMEPTESKALPRSQHKGPAKRSSLRKKR